MKDKKDEKLKELLLEGKWSQLFALRDLGAIDNYTLAKTIMEDLEVDHIHERAMLFAQLLK
jgi:hypothetical protein